MSINFPILSPDNLSSTIIDNLSLFVPELLVVFAIIGFITQSFSKNMIMILTIPLILTALYVTIFNRIKTMNNSKINI